MCVYSLKWVEEFGVLFYNLVILHCYFFVLFLIVAFWLRFHPTTTRVVAVMPSAMDQYTK